jgi:hypothetical protein
MCQEEQVYQGWPQGDMDNTCYALGRNNENEKHTIMRSDITSSRHYYTVYRARQLDVCRIAVRDLFIRSFANSTSVTTTHQPWPAMFWIERGVGAYQSKNKALEIEMERRNTSPSVQSWKLQLKRWTIVGTAEKRSIYPIQLLRLLCTVSVELAIEAFLLPWLYT